MDPHRRTDLQRAAGPAVREQRALFGEPDPRPAVNSTGTGRRIASRSNPRRKRLIAFGWYGGKYSHLDFILPNIPRDATHFCDVFGGSAAVLFNREPSPVETWNDLDSEEIAAWLDREWALALDGDAVQADPEADRLVDSDVVSIRYAAMTQ